MKTVILNAKPKENEKASFQNLLSQNLPCNKASG